MRRLAIFVAVLICCFEPLPRVRAQDAPPGCDPAFLINSLADYKSSKDTLEDLQILSRLDDEIQTQLKACMSLVTTPTPAPLSSPAPTRAITGPVLPPTSTAPFGSRDNPVPYGQTLELEGRPGSGFGMATITITDVDTTADRMLANANQFNDPAGSGQSYYFAQVHVSIAGRDPNKDFPVSYSDFTSLSDSQLLSVPILVWPSLFPKLDIRLLSDSTGWGFVLGKWFTDDPHPMLVLWRTDTFPGYFFDVKRR